MLYNTLKLFHILCAVAAVGSNLTYAVWFLFAAKENEHLDFALRGVKALDDRVANPAYLGLGISGPLLVWAGGLEWTQAWVLGGIVLLASTSVLGLAVYTPLLRRQIAALAAHGPASPQYHALSSRGAWMGLGFGLLNLLTFILMVFKPAAF